MANRDVKRGVRQPLNSTVIPMIKTIASLIAIVLLLLLSQQPTEPVSAQGYSTPTLLPAIIATQQAAQQAQAQAAQQKAEAARMQAQAAEMERNAEAQTQAAEQALSDARAAAAAQNAAMFGEAIGKAESNLAELRNTVSGLKSLNDRLVGDNSELSAQVISVTTALQQARAVQQTTAAAYAAVQQKLDERGKSDTTSNILWVFGFVVVACLVGLLIYGVVTRQHITTTATVEDTPIDTSYIDVEAPQETP